MILALRKWPYLPGFYWHFLLLNTYCILESRPTVILWKLNLFAQLDHYISLHVNTVFRFSVSGNMVSLIIFLPPSAHMLLVLPSWTTFVLLGNWNSQLFFFVKNNHLHLFCPIYSIHVLECQYTAVIFCRISLLLKSVAFILLTTLSVTTFRHQQWYASWSCRFHLLPRHLLPNISALFSVS